ncbi:PDR/VanB family oxidoreductase [Mesorhizobium sp. 1B3]|uniref:PDR/VanB family oxidoreductase n=1 Tax=Mesorhizobium sp. 1B3 TaxID=3243599 RepID=UPI003D964096
MQANVQAIARIADGIVHIRLKPDTGQGAPESTPGSHIDLHLPNGLVRQYSLLTPQRGETIDIAVNLDPQSRGGSAYVHQVLKVGDKLEISHPRNHFPLTEHAEQSIFIAGGIGITPIHAMVHRLTKLGRRWVLYHCTRTPERTPFATELRELAAASQGSIIHVHDGVPGIRPLDVSAIIEAADETTHFYCCGPTPLMASFEAATANIPPHRVHVEYFVNEEAQAAGSEFELVCARSGKRVTIPSDRSILETLEAQGLAPLCSCREGTCGTCETAVLQGEPDHRDRVLTPDERASNSTMMICVSRAKGSSITLDI